MLSNLRRSYTFFFFFFSCTFQRSIQCNALYTDAPAPFTVSRGTNACSRASSSFHRNIQLLAHLHPEGEKKKKTGPTNNTERPVRFHMLAILIEILHVSHRLNLLSANTDKHFCFFFFALPCRFESYPSR